MTEPTLEDLARQLRSYAELTAEYDPDGWDNYERICLHVLKRAKEE